MATNIEVKGDLIDKQDQIFNINLTFSENVYNLGIDDFDITGATVKKFIRSAENPAVCTLTLQRIGLSPISLTLKSSYDNSFGVSGEAASGITLAVSQTSNVNQPTVPEVPVVPTNPEPSTPNLPTPDQKPPEKPVEEPTPVEQPDPIDLPEQPVDQPGPTPPTTPEQPEEKKNPEIPVDPREPTPTDPEISDPPVDTTNPSPPETPTTPSDPPKRSPAPLPIPNPPIEDDPPGTPPPEDEFIDPPPSTGGGGDHDRPPPTPKVTYIYVPAIVKIYKSKTSLQDLEKMFITVYRSGHYASNVSYGSENITVPLINKSNGDKYSILNTYTYYITTAAGVKYTQIVYVIAKNGVGNINFDLIYKLPKDQIYPNGNRTIYRWSGRRFINEQNSYGDQIVSDLDREMVLNINIPERLGSYRPTDLSKIYRITQNSALNNVCSYLSWGYYYYGYQTVYPYRLGPLYLNNYRNYLSNNRNAIRISSYEMADDADGTHIKLNYVFDMSSPTTAFGFFYKKTIEERPDIIEEQKYLLYKIFSKYISTGNIFNQKYNLLGDGELVTGFEKNPSFLYFGYSADNDTTLTNGTQRLEAKKKWFSRLDQKYFKQILKCKAETSIESTILQNGKEKKEFKCSLKFYFNAEFLPTIDHLTQLEASNIVHFIGNTNNFTANSYNIAYSSKFNDIFLQNTEDPSKVFVLDRYTTYTGNNATISNWAGFIPAGDYTMIAYQTPKTGQMTDKVIEDEIYIPNTSVQTQSDSNDGYLVADIRNLTYQETQSGAKPDLIVQEERVKNGKNITVSVGKKYKFKVYENSSLYTLNVLTEE
jgi:hypothetical protein